MNGGGVTVFFAQKLDSQARPPLRRRAAPSSSGVKIKMEDPQAKEKKAALEAEEAAKL